MKPNRSKSREILFEAMNGIIRRDESVQQLPTLLPDCKQQQTSRHRKRERERERVSLRDALKATDRARIHAHCSRAPWSTALHRVVLRRRTKCRTLRRAAQGVRYPRNRFVRDNIPPSGSVCTTSIPLLMATNWPSSSEIRLLCA